MSDIGRRFWTACAERRFTLPRCTGCNRLRWYLLPTCPRCHAVGYDWAELSGDATLFTFTVVHRGFHPDVNDQIPYVTAFVIPTEDEDVRFVTRLIDFAIDRLRIGTPMQVVFTESNGRLKPFFRPIV
jgi:uncharacterized OB-fold protein